MVFNWFRRQFTDPAKASPATETEPAGVETPEAAAPETAQPETSTPQAEDYLNWAKLAYQNIQKRQQEQTATSEAEPEPEPAPEPALEPEPPPEPETAIATPEPAPEPTLEPTLEPTPAPETAIAEPEPTLEPTPAPETAIAEPAPLPFWARAEAERQERLERLRATAIEEAEPEAAPSPPVTATTETTTLPPDLSVLAFDEGFLWSAEILAAQGRRPEEISVEEITWLQKLRQGLGKTRRSLINQLKAIVGQGPLNQDAVMEIEALLLQADVGVKATDQVISALQARLRQEALPPEVAIAYLKQILREILDRPLRETYSPTFAPEKGSLNIWLIAGVNGAGKTTTIGKITHLARASGYECLIAAADTFRAAAVEQVKIWGQRSQVEVIANPGQNTDPAAVVFDAIAAAQSRGTELLLVDTAGRLQNKKNLMEELSKIRRIIDRKAPNAKIESLLVLDATLGQNGLRQAEVFAEAAQLTGVVLTKLDGTAKGGVALAVVQQMGLPIRFIGAGEGIEDLRPFSSYEFVEALLSS